ncbi:MAG: leucyl/phenylalanyl-tRNA--protein transferase [Osedax symbiont Rs2]|nr:MAG: leucyl/phenylalanyl-tRNA--protein transferase [Osedax symbiont Rs2]
MIPWLAEDNYCFPDINSALQEPNGLLAAGGDLSPGRLISAYRQGIFPWFSEDDPILWWSPAPRCVLIPQRLHVSKSLAKVIRKNQFQITFDQAFDQVIDNCSALRRNREGTWITDEMQSAYSELSAIGVAHSVEVWQQGELVGGLYGLCIGNIFFGESMFSSTANASKVAFCYLARQLQDWGFSLIDCQLHSDHLQSMGAEEISREKFQQFLQRNPSSVNDTGNAKWSFSIASDDIC